MNGECPPVGRDLMAPETEPTDEELQTVMREACDLAMRRKAESDRWLKHELDYAAREARERMGATMVDPTARSHLLILESSGNVFADINFSPEEAAILMMRAELMVVIREAIEANQWIRKETAERLGIGLPRVSDLVRGKQEKFSLDMLVMLAIRAGRHVKLTLS